VRVFFFNGIAVRTRQLQPVGQKKKKKKTLPNPSREKREGLKKNVRDRPLAEPSAFEYTA
jgi:hypothetical protein